jgi:hypothetical protein
MFVVWDGIGRSIGLFLAVAQAASWTKITFIVGATIDSGGNVVDFQHT